MAKKPRKPKSKIQFPLPKKKEGPPFGSKNALKFHTAEERQEAYRLYCLHIAAGYAGSSFYEPCVEETIENLLKRHPEEFDLIELKRARARGRMLWEDIGKQGTIGKIKNFNANSWKLNMQNRLGWKDRTETGMDRETRAVFTLRMGKELSKPETEQEEE